MTADLLAMRDWLISEHVSVVGMEATGAYWKPIFYLLESDVECWLLNARHMKTVPGRKTDVKDWRVDRETRRARAGTTKFRSPSTHPAATGPDSVPHRSRA